MLAVIKICEQAKFMSIQAKIGIISHCKYSIEHSYLLQTHSCMMKPPIYQAQEISLAQAASHVNMHTVYGNEIKFWWARFLNSSSPKRKAAGLTFTMTSIVGWEIWLCQISTAVAAHFNFYSAFTATLHILYWTKCDFQVIFQLGTFTLSNIRDLTD